MTPGKGGLAQAQDKILGLVDELDRTLDLVNRLSGTGDEEVALRLLDEQRRQLYDVMNTISRDVGTRTGWIDRVRRNTTAVVAAAALTMSALAAVSASVIIRQAPATPVEQLDAAATIPDATERLRVVIDVWERTRNAPLAEQRAIEADLRQALEETVDEAKDNPASKELVAEAEAAIEDMEEGEPPKPPSAPGSEQGPVESLKDLIDP